MNISQVVQFVTHNSLLLICMHVGQYNDPQVYVLRWTDTVSTLNGMSVSFK